MDEQAKRRAHRNGGLVTITDLGTHPGRQAGRVGLVVVQPRVLIAQTQPVGPTELLLAVRTSIESDYAFLGDTALWIYGISQPPDAVEVGVAHATRFRARAPVLVRRVAPSVLRGTRTLAGSSVVAVEVAVLQACAARQPGEVRALLERVLRDRRTTMPRLRGRCRRGLAGSAAVRRALDELAGLSLDGAVRRLRTALENRGIDGLRIEVRFASDDGESAYVDLLDEQSSTAVEVDGYVSHTERERFRADRRRDRWMHGQRGIVTLRVDAAETVAPELEALADELAATLHARRAALRPTA
jgi:hypothetical protein